MSMKLRAILLLGSACLWIAQGIIVGTNRNNRTNSVSTGRVAKKHTNHTRLVTNSSLNKTAPTRKLLRVPPYAHHKHPLLNEKDGHYAFGGELASGQLVNFAARKALEVAEKKAHAELQKEQEIKKAAHCSKVGHHTASHKACKNFMRELCHLGEKGGGATATMEEVEKYCENFYILRTENQHEETETPEDKSSAMPWSNQKKPGPLPEHGYWGEKVEHKNMNTFTGDWRQEFGPRQEGEQNIHEICMNYPDHDWCRMYRRHYGPSGPSYSYGLPDGRNGSGSGGSSKVHGGSGADDPRYSGNGKGDAYGDGGNGGDGDASWTPADGVGAGGRGSAAHRSTSVSLAAVLSLVAAVVTLGTMAESMVP